MSRRPSDAHRPSAALLVARLTLREITRRRTVLALLLLLPVSFYGARRDLQGQSIRMLVLGLGWAIATLAFFTASSARAIDLRLRMAGMPVTTLVLGRQLAMTGAGLVLAAANAVLIAVDQDVRRYQAVLLMLLVTVLIAAPLGATLAAVMPRELEGALALVVVLATQMIADPAGTLAKCLPFWSTREVASYAIDPVDVGYLTRGLVHGAITLVVLMTVALGAASIRLRLIRLPAPTETENQATATARRA
jgi:hypothetical protein